MNWAQSLSFQYSLQAPRAETSLELSVGCQTLEAMQVKQVWVIRM